jgi:hypothetical protein
MSTSTTVEAALKGADLQNLLEHIAWTDILEPELQRRRQLYQDMICKKVLGEPTQNQMSLEQLAGRVAGIDYTLNIIKHVLTKGESALKSLRESGIHLE